MEIRQQKEYLHLMAPPPMRNAKPREPYSSELCSPWWSHARCTRTHHPLRWRRNTHKYIIESSLMVSTVIHLVCTYFVYLVICITFIFKWVHTASRSDQLYDRTASWNGTGVAGWCGWKMQRECHYILVCFYYLSTLTHTHIYIPGKSTGRGTHKKICSVRASVEFLWREIQWENTIPNT